eukprot:10604541-Alexandrium_andersonii.AAC.1
MCIRDRRPRRGLGIGGHGQPLGSRHRRCRANRGASGGRRRGSRALDHRRLRPWGRDFSLCLSGPEPRPYGT